MKKLTDELEIGTLLIMKMGMRDCGLQSTETGPAARDISLQPICVSHPMQHLLLAQILYTTAAAQRAPKSDGLDDC
jgi:hypothetical protein